MGFNQIKGNTFIKQSWHQLDGLLKGTFEEMYKEKGGNV